MQAPKDLVLINENYKSLDPNADSGIPLSVITQTVATNYTICQLNAEQLISLQSWLITQKELHDKESKPKSFFNWFD